MFGLFKKNKPGKAYDGPALDPEWARNKRGKFHRLNLIEGIAEGLGGFSAVYVIWHSGVKPGWVYVGRTNDLATALDEAADNEDIQEYERNGGLFVSWSPIVANRQNGVLRYLHDAMKPKVKNRAAHDIEDGPIKVIPPKRK